MDSFCHLKVYFMFFMFVIHLKKTKQSTLEEELTLSLDEKIKLDKFRESVFNRLPHDYMNEDLYLVRFLRTQNWNVNAAEEMLMKNIRWRQENNMDNILNEDFSEFDEFRFGVEGCDKHGHPVVSIFAGEWDVLQLVLSGKLKRFNRFMDRVLEDATTMIRRIQKEGQNVTQFVELIDLNGFSIGRHGCPACLSIYATHLLSYEQHYPLSVHKVYTVNTPAYFHSVHQIMKPFLSPATRKIIKLYGRSEWKASLGRDIDKENLSKSFGGVKEESVDFRDIRNNLVEYQCKIGDKVFAVSYNEDQ